MLDENKCYRLPGDWNTTQVQVELQTQVPCDCQRQRHHPPIGNCNGRGLRILPRPLSSRGCGGGFARRFEPSFQPLEIDLSHYPTSTISVRAEAPISATNHLTSYRASNTTLRSCAKQRCGNAAQAQSTRYRGKFLVKANHRALIRRLTCGDIPLCMLTCTKEPRASNCTFPMSPGPLSFSPLLAGHGTYRPRFDISFCNTAKEQEVRCKPVTKQISSHELSTNPHTSFETSQPF